jgi:F-type H+-transporting ATPase subunit delta
MILLPRDTVRQYFVICDPLCGGSKRLDFERVDVSEPASISSGIAARYATAVFELSKDAKGLKALETDIDAMGAALGSSDDLRTLISSPLYSRAEQGGAIGAVAKKMKLSTTMTNTLALMASKRRLFVVPQLIASLHAKIAEEKGEVTANVVSAKALTKAQSDKLAKTLSASFDADVKIIATVDETLIGGLIVKVGSKMIDTSIKSKLNALQNTMKEAR